MAPFWGPGIHGGSKFPGREGSAKRRCPIPLGREASWRSEAASGPAGLAQVCSQLQRQRGMRRTRAHMAPILGAPQAASPPRPPGLGGLLEIQRVGEGGKTPVPGPSTRRLRPEITGASRKIISICLGRSEVGRQRLRPPSGNGPRPTADQGRPLRDPGSNSGCRQHPPGPGSAGARTKGRGRCRRGSGPAVGGFGARGGRSRSSPRSRRSRPALGGARAGGSPGSVWK